MARTQKAFERRFRDLFDELRARDREKGLAWTRHQAQLKLRHGAPTPSHAYTQVLIALLHRTRPFRERQHHASPFPENSSPSQLPLRLHCDAGLGGLARWLRASGCEAFWRQDISDADLVRETQQLGGILLTTDSLLLERRPIVRGEIRALWIPPNLTMHEQLRYLRAEFNLPSADSPDFPDSRCMRCGGELIPINKQQARDRIPPRTYVWLDEFYECATCHQLFWHGTHWQRVQAKMKDIATLAIA